MRGSLLQCGLARSHGKELQMVKRATVFALGILLLLSATPASAITTGVPDGEEHPYVGQLLFYDADFQSAQFDDPGGWFSCSATMLSPTVIVTAGHCTYGVGLEGESTTAEGGDGSGGTDMWFDNSEEAHFEGFPPSSNYEADENEQRYIDRAAFLDASPFWHEATAYPHPEYVNDGTFYLHDAGVVVLDDPLQVDEYGEIPGLGYLDRYKGSPRHLFEVVGYGLTKSGPFTEEGGDIRLKGLVKLNSLKGSPKDTYILLSNNPGRPHRGGTCFGDSGGPTFDDTDSNLVVAVTSFGFSSTCTGVGGAYRLDQPDDLAFLASFGITP
jgi:Trypsin